jgi:hypothetical protein
MKGEELENPTWALFREQQSEVGVVIDGKSGIKRIVPGFFLNVFISI